MSKQSRESRVINGIWVISEGFTLYAFIKCVAQAQIINALLSALTLLFLAIPRLLEHRLPIRLHPAVHVLVMCFTSGPLLGDVYQFYYLIPWWDLLLHLQSGFLAALAGYYLTDGLDWPNRHHSTALHHTLALTTALAVGVVWEFLEYGGDCLLPTDMQQDTLVSSIHSYRLGSDTGEVGHIRQIQSVLINGSTPAWGSAYLDIGLHDTMTDLLSGAAGALSYSLLQDLTRRRRPWVEILPQPEQAAKPGPKPGAPPAVTASTGSFTDSGPQTHNKWHARRGDRPGC